MRTVLKRFRENYRNAENTNYISSKENERKKRTETNLQQNAFYPIKSLNEYFNELFCQIKLPLCYQ